MQWHPLFADLLRLLVQDYYEVQTNVPVGDLPREADIVLLRRTAQAPFVGIWRHLTTWNVLELKGPSDDPALRDLDLLLEVGLGLDRRLNEQRQREGQPLLDRSEVSWWFLANHLGTRFLAEVRRVLGSEPRSLGPGLWVCPALGRELFLVSRDALPVDRESVPLHLVTDESVEQKRALAQEVVRQPGFWALYGIWLARLHPDALAEVQRMIASLENQPQLDLRPLIEAVGLKQVIDQVGLKQVIDQVGLKQVIDQVGLKQVIDQVGLQEVLQTAGAAAVIAALGLDRLLTAEQLQELQRRLSEGKTGP